MSPEQIVAARKGKQLAALIESTTFDGERSNALDAYSRLCAKHRLDTTTLRPVDEPPESSAHGMDEYSRLRARFFEEQALNPEIEFDSWFETKLEALRRGVWLS